MRWLVLATVQLSAIGAIVALIVHGPSLWLVAPATYTSSLLFWLVRHLFRH